MAWFRSQMSEFVDVDRAQQRWGISAMTPEQIIAMLSPWKEAGMGYAIVNFPDAAYDQSGIELFAREVVPALG